MCDLKLAPRDRYAVGTGLTPILPRTAGQQEERRKRRGQEETDSVSLSLVCPFTPEVTIPDDLMGATELIGKVHAVDTDGRVFVIEYRDARRYQTVVIDHGR